jgi:hypothetical protein
MKLHDRIWINTFNLSLSRFPTKFDIQEAFLLHPYTFNLSLSRFSTKFDIQEAFLLHPFELRLALRLGGMSLGAVPVALCVCVGVGGGGEKEGK